MFILAARRSGRYSAAMAKVMATAFAGLSACVLLGACVHNNNGAPGTYISSSTDSKKGLVTQITRGDESAVAASPDGRVGSLRGVSIRHKLLLGIIQWGSAGVGDAAQKGAPEFRFRNSPYTQIREVDTVEHGGVKILWGILYSNEQTIVTGEGGESEAPASSK
jgi:hypothetical protein